MSGASDEVRVVEGTTWVQSGSRRFEPGPTQGPYEEHALMVLGSGLAAGQIKAALRCRKRFAAAIRWLEEAHPEVFREGLWDAIEAATDTGGTP